MKIDDFDLRRRKNRKRLRAEQRQCEIPISNFPKSSDCDKIIDICNDIEHLTILGPSNRIRHLADDEDSDLLDKENSHCPIIKLLEHDLRDQKIESHHDYCPLKLDEKLDTIQEV